MSLWPEHISALLADEDCAAFSLVSLKEMSWLAKWKVKSGLLKGQFDSQTNFELIKTMFMLKWKQKKTYNSLA